MTESFHGDELQTKNFEGGVIYLDWSIGYLAGWAGSYMLAGINLELMKAAMMPWAGGVFLHRAIMSAPVFIKTHGRMEGLADSIGGGLMFGQMAYQDAEPLPQDNSSSAFPAGNYRAAACKSAFSSRLVLPSGN